MAEFRTYPDPEAVAQAAADYLFEKITDCVQQTGICHVVLPGGSTPARCLELLSERPLPWQQVHWYPGDERCYPVGHEERNDTMILARLFSRHQHGASQLHPIPAELGPERAAKLYADLVDAAGGIDIVVLGMGEDGHTASLFPGNPALQDQASAVAVYNAPKAPGERVSIGLSALQRAAQCIIIATGENKAEALEKVMSGEPLPVALIEPDVWFTDEAAAVKIKNKKIQSV